MNFFNSLFLIEIYFCILNVIQGFVLSLSLFLLIFLKGAYLLSKEFRALRKLFIVKSTFFHSGLKDWTNLYQNNPR